MQLNERETQLIKRAASIALKTIRKEIEILTFQCEVAEATEPRELSTKMMKQALVEIIELRDELEEFSNKDNYVSL